MRDGYNLPDLADTPSDELRLWHEVVNKVTEPAAEARLGELLIATERSSIGTHLPRTVSAYLSAVVGKTDSGTTTYLVRAHTLCRTLTRSSSGIGCSTKSKAGSTRPP